METSIDSLLIVGIIPGGGCYCVGCSSKVWFSSLHLVGAADGTPTSSTFENSTSHKSWISVGVNI